MIMGRNSQELTEAEDIKKMQQEYRDELYKKGLNEMDNHLKSEYWNVKSSGPQETLP